MKFERLDENKIRCTLTKAELAEKHINLTELAYGTDKAKALFKDLMDQARDELGFEVDDMPLMIEAIPVKPDSLMLIITKVSNPDEMNSRFSKFAGLNPNEIVENLMDGEQSAPETPEQTTVEDAWKEEASDSAPARRRGGSG